MSNARNLARLLPNTSGQLPDAAMSSGSVLQVVQGDIGAITTTSGSTVYSGSVVNITPTFSTSKVLIMASPGINIDVDNDASGNNNGFFRLEYSINGGAWTQAGDAVAIPGRGGNGNFSNFDKLISPNTTSQIQVRVGIGKYEGSRTIQANTSWGSNAITLMEIAA